MTPKFRFRDLPIGATFDWIDDNAPFTSFYDPCEKISTRRYRSLRTGLVMAVGTINVIVHHPNLAISGPS